MRRLAALTTAGALAVAGLTLAPGGAAHAATPTIRWGPCADSGLLNVGAQCGFLSVPLDHAKPDGKKIQLAVSRAKATAAKRQGVLLVNPGGPGGSGLGMAALRDVLPREAGTGYDWIGFDPRGVGSSKPAVSCDPAYATGPRPAYVPIRAAGGPAAEEKAWLARSKKYAQDCGKKYGELLEHLKSLDTVRDMELLRIALGAEQINYFGFSYGTYLGQLYATLYPDRVRRMVLDGNVHPGEIWYTAQLSQDRAFEKVVEEFFAWVARNNNIYGLGKSAAVVRDAYDGVLAKLRRKPQGQIGESEWTDNFSRAMYAEFLWPDTAAQFASFVHQKDIAPAEAAYRAQQDGDNGFAIYNATQCTDVPWPASYEKTWRPDAVRTAAGAPFLTWANVWFNTACLYWPAKAGKPVEVDGSKAPPILLINATLDAATPFAAALEVRKRFPKARLLAEEGATSHANSFGAGPCVKNRVVDFLLSGQLPARKSGPGPDVVCKRGEFPHAGFVSFKPSSHTPDPADSEPVPADEQPARPADSEPGPAGAPPSQAVPPAERSMLDRLLDLLP